MNSNDLSKSTDFRPFLDFYNKHDVIPVSQNLDVIDDFVFRRNYLYTKLGAPLRQFKNKTILEFGPGGGYNAVATSKYQPNLYVFVDASTESLRQLHQKHDENQFNAHQIEINNSNIFDYQDLRKYDCVIIEGTIPGQIDPNKMIRHASSFVDRGGLLLTTTISAASVLSEICRKLLKVKIAEVSQDFESQVDIAVSIFGDHLSSLGTSTRPTIDWVLDMIFNDWHKGRYIFTLPDTIQAIKQEFEFYQSSPSFVTDDRWYKKVTKSSADSNDLLMQQYSNMAACLIDYRLDLRSILKTHNDLTDIERLSTLACEIHDVIINNESYDNLDEFFRIILEIKELLPFEFNLTRLAIDDFIISMKGFIENHKTVNFSEFRKWWGRGQQYASFIRR
jgi:hypothetical protein